MKDDTMENEISFENAVVENREEFKINAVDIAKLGGSSVFMKRWAATIIDFVLLAALILVSVFGSIASENDPIFAITSHLTQISIWIIIAYYLLIEGLTGYTLGKFIMRIKVVNNDFNVPGLGRGFIRSIMRLIELNPLFLGGLPAGITVLASKNKQRLGDMAAGTYVLNVRDFTVEKKPFPVYKTIIIIVISVLVVAVLALGTTTSAGYLGKTLEGNATSIIVSKDSNYQANFPRGWTDYGKKAADLNIYSYNQSDESFFMLITTDKKEPNELSMTFYEGIINKVIDSIFQNSSVNNLARISVNNYPATQYEITGDFDNEKIAGYATIVETPKAYHYIIAWLPQKDTDIQNKEELKTITNSFKEHETVESK